MSSESQREVAALEGLPQEPCNVADYERIAREKLDAGAYGYFAGGAGDEHTLNENVAAYRRWQLRPRALVDVRGATTVTTVLGTEVAMPLLVAPWHSSEWPTPMASRRWRERSRLPAR